MAGLARQWKYTTREDEHLLKLQGTWTGSTILPSVRCHDSNTTPFLCCLQNPEDAISMKVKVVVARTSNVATLEFGYDNEVNTTLSNGMRVYQPSMSWRARIARIDLVGQTIVVRMAAYEKDICVYVSDDSLTRNSDRLNMFIRTRTTASPKALEDQFWCWDPPLPRDGCVLGTVWPDNLVANSSDSMRSPWQTFSFELLRHPVRIAAGSMTSTTSSSAGRSDVLLTIGTSVSAMGVVCLCTLLLIFQCRSKLSRRQSNQQTNARSTTEGPVEPDTPNIASRAEPEPLSVGISEESTHTWCVDDALVLGMREHWAYKGNEIELEEQVSASGKFGDVRKGILLGSTAVAVKSCRHNAKFGNVEDMLANEMRVLRRIRHPNIVLFFGIWEQSDGTAATNLGLVLEWVHGADLKKYIRHASSTDHPEQSSTTTGLAEYHDSPPVIHRVFLLRDVSVGVHFLHAQDPQILHRDLKPANILVETTASPPRAKITDFGLSVVLRGGDVKSRAGTHKYMAPEVLAGGPSNACVDVFSFGCTCGFALSRVHAKQWRAQATLRSALVAAQAVEETIQLLVSCLKEAAHQRPSMAQVHMALDVWSGSLVEKREGTAGLSHSSSRAKVAL
eukprot:CAMPEP_0117470452 /NCGR_PEP_ID=MMETSP0784-20121206/7223_1 /TAXON_ID=39447 /ORGANISM="" /LENGTH=618 /DNA_ID=CAMNT_0005264541 /DNA_START=39 /DNA_END=1895 /DNA_ORIENTATION=-